jgi:N-acetylneuraminic acid mutarotase
MKQLYLFVFLLALTFTCAATGTWNQISILSGGACDMPFSFSIGAKGYVGGGRTALTSFKSDFWEFDPVTNVWVQKASYPAGNMGSQASFVINDKAYVGLGYDLQYKNQFYEYDPLTNIWIQKATFPGGARYSSSWFTIGNSGYVVGGWNGALFNDCWQYTPATDSWVQMADFPGGNRQATTAFAIDSLGYVCNGFSQPVHFNDMWEFNPSLNTWTAKAPFPGTARRGCPSFVINNEAYVGLGYDGVYLTDFYKYNNQTDSWSQVADFGGSARYNTSYFTINNKGYIGGGSYDPITSPAFKDDFWEYEPASNCNLVQGKAFVDFNSNNVHDTLEPSLTNRKIIESNTGNIAFTNQNGFYSLSVCSTGNFVVMFMDSLDNFSPAPSSYPVNFTTSSEIDSLNDFAIQPVGIFDDLCLTISPTGNFRSGMSASYIINYTNAGNTVINGTVVFYPDTNLAFDYSVPAATSVTTDSVVIDLGNLNPFQSGQIIVAVMVDLGLPIGTPISSSAMILPIIGDVNPSCNFATWDLLTTGSYDPNDIMVNRNFIFDYQVASQPDLEYLIRFQNTGNDTAFTVRVMNPIDTTGLLLNTFEFVAASHPGTITWLPAEKSMRFLFENILLADSNTNEALSHGFIRYKIKPKSSLVLGDSITSQAFIFFDFNSAVPTNIARTDIISPVGFFEAQVPNEIFYLYPNPVRSTLNIHFNSNLTRHDELEIYNVYGQKIQTIKGRKSDGNPMIKLIDVSGLASGIYFIKAGNGDAVKRFVKY